MKTQFGVITTCFGFDLTIMPRETASGEYRHSYEENKDECDDIIRQTQTYMINQLKALERKVKENSSCLESVNNTGLVSSKKSKNKS